MRVWQRFRALVHPTRNKIWRFMRLRGYLDTRKAPPYPVLVPQLGECRVSDRDLLNAVMVTQDYVRVPADDSFQKAVEMSPEAYDEVFERDVRSHEGFSGTAPKPANK